MAHGPIEDKYRDQLRDIGRLLDKSLNPNGVKVTGFVMLMFDFGIPAPTSRISYLSNAQREDMLCAMKEFIANAEGRVTDETGHG